MPVKMQTKPFLCFLAEKKLTTEIDLKDFLSRSEILSFSPSSRVVSIKSPSSEPKNPLTSLTFCAEKNGERPHSCQSGSLKLWEGEGIPRYRAFCL